MARRNHRFLKNRSELFFARGLDDPNQLEPACEIRFCAHAVLGVIEMDEKAMAHQNRTDLPDDRANQPTSLPSCRRSIGQRLCLLQHLDGLANVGIEARAAGVEM